MVCTLYVYGSFQSDIKVMPYLSVFKKQLDAFSLNQSTGIKSYAGKRIYTLSVRHKIEQSIHQDHCLSSSANLMMSKSDPWDRFFFGLLTPLKTVILTQVCCRVNVLKFRKLFCFCSHIKCWFSGLELTKCLSE